MSKYEVQMDNGENAEANTIQGAMLAARTMAQDSGWEVDLDEVLVGGRPCEWAWSAVIEHLIETEALEIEAVEGAGDDQRLDD